MPIVMRCDCGATLQAKDEHAGKKTRCPSCGKIQPIPAAAPPPARPTFSLSKEEEIPDALPAEDGKKVKGSDTYGFADQPSPRPKVREPLERPRVTKSGGRAAARGGGGGFFGPEMGAMSYGVLGGLAMMAIAVIWFVAGLFFDYIFFYPPILFVIGIVAVVRGVMSGNIAGGDN
jgi:hypothetical protein